MFCVLDMELIRAHNRLPAYDICQPNWPVPWLFVADYGSPFSDKSICVHPAVAGQQPRYKQIAGSSHLFVQHRNIGCRSPDGLVCDPDPMKKRLIG
jgi:hypothetical protein